MNILAMRVLMKWVCSFATKETRMKPTCSWFTRQYTCQLCPSLEPWPCASCTYGPERRRPGDYFKPPYCSIFRGRSRAGPVRARHSVDHCERLFSHQQSERMLHMKKSPIVCFFSSKRSIYALRNWIFGSVKSNSGKSLSKITRVGPQMYFVVWKCGFSHRH